MASFNWFLSKPTNDITFLHIFNNLPLKFCSESVVSIASYTLKTTASLLKINKSSLWTLAYFAIDCRMKLFFFLVQFSSSLAKNYTTFSTQKLQHYWPLRKNTEAATGCKSKFIISIRLWAMSFHLKTN